MIKKCLLICCCCIFTIFGFSQTTTKKYNEYQERYEYFDQNGNMIGYQKYNSYLNQWEYFEVQIQQNNRSEYIQPYDLDLLQKGLQYKQNAYESNVEYIQNRINQVNQTFDYFNKYRETREIQPYLLRIERLQNQYLKGINEINSARADYSKKANVNRVLNWLSQFERALTDIINKVNQ